MRKIFLLGAAGLIVLVLFIIGITTLQKHSAQSAARVTSDSFVADILANKASDSYQFFTDYTKQGLTQDEWAVQVQKLSSFFTGAKPSYQGATASSSSNLITYTIRGSDGTYTFSIVLGKPAKTLQVQSFNSQLKG
jgi:hypothetical protein